MLKPLEEKRLNICEEECEHYESCSSNMFVFDGVEISPVSWYLQEAIDVNNEKENHGETRGLENISAKADEALKILKIENNKKTKATYGK